MKSGLWPRARQSTGLQLFVTLAASLAAAGFLAVRGLPPLLGLDSAAGLGDEAQAWQALKWGVPVDLRGGDGRTPLHHVTCYDSIRVARILIAHGAGVNARDNRGWTPLHWVAYGGEAEVAEFLIAQRAEVNARDHDGLTPLDRASTEVMASELLNHGAGARPPY